MCDLYVLVNSQNFNNRHANKQLLNSEIGPILKHYCIFIFIYLTLVLCSGMRFPKAF